MRAACFVALLLVSLARVASTQDREPRRSVPSAASLTIGLAEVDTAANGCLAINAAGLAPGTRLTLVWMPTDTSPSAMPELLEARITASLPGPCDRTQPAEAGDRYYAIAVSGASEVGPGVRFAVLRPRDALDVTGQRVKADLDADGVLEQFRSCTSTEGLHMTVWSGAPLTGTRRWHRYHYLGYDVDPTCDSRDYAP